MSEASPVSPASRTPAKPGTACLGCRRRKLKCSREQEGCRNCLKADLPCVYPVAPETGIKRKRGPYKKDKPPRERHLENLVKYLEPRTSSANHTGDGSPSNNGGDRAEGRNMPGRPHTATGTPRSHESLLRQNSHPEDLVKDALIALTKSSVSERENQTDSGAHSSYMQPSFSASDLRSSTLHPPARQVFELWHLFVSRVDPLTKIVHCPTTAKRLFVAIDSKDAMEPIFETLMASIYYAAITTCTANETRRRFGDSRDVLLQRYGRVIESALANNYGMPALESVQALVIYIICLRRQGVGSNVRALFGLAVRMAQLMGLHEDPGEAFSPFEVEYRRRLWWHICGLESQGAEEGGARPTSIMEGRYVQFPANLNDHDLDPKATQRPVARVGVTDTTFPVMRFKVMQLVHHVWAIRKEYGPDKSPSTLEKVRAAQSQALEEVNARMNSEYLRHFDSSRPYDWMCQKILSSMLTKVRMMIDHPFGKTPSKDMTPEERYRLLQSSVTIISDTHDAAVDPRIEGWHWFFRAYVQWHSLGIVVAELGRSSNRQFTTSAWAVLDPILADWDRIYQKRKDEPAWDHVNALIERAKEMRLQSVKTPAAKITHRPKSDAPLPSRPPPQKVQRTNDSASVAPPPPPALVPTTYIAQQPAPAAAPSYATPPMQGATPEMAAQEILTPSSMDAGPSGGANNTITNNNNNHFAYPAYTPPMMGFDSSLGTFDTLEDIDFSAFDAVFGSANWEFPSPLAEFNMEVG